MVAVRATYAEDNPPAEPPDPAPPPSVNGTKPQGQTNGVVAAEAGAVKALEDAAFRIHWNLSMMEGVGGGRGGGDGAAAAADNEDGAAAAENNEDDAMKEERNEIRADDSRDTQAFGNFQSIVADTLNCITTHFPHDAPSEKSSAVAYSRATKSLYKSLVTIAAIALDGNYSSPPSTPTPPSSPSSSAAAARPDLSLVQAAELLLTATSTDRSTLPRFLSFKQQADLSNRASDLASLRALYLKGPTLPLPPSLPSSLSTPRLTVLNDICLNEFRALVPPAQRMAHIEEARQRLEYALHQHGPFRVCQVMVFGSAYCGLGTSQRYVGGGKKGGREGGRDGTGGGEQKQGGGCVCVAFALGWGVAWGR